MSSSDASVTPNADRLKFVVKKLRPRGANAEDRTGRLLVAIEAAAFSLILDDKGGKDDLRSFVQAFGRQALEVRLSAANIDALSALVMRLEPKRRRVPQGLGELVDVVMRKLGSVKEPSDQVATGASSQEAVPQSVPTREAIFAYSDEAALRALLDGFPVELLKKIRLEHGLMYSALPPPKAKKDEIEHIVASVFRRRKGSILDQMEFSPRTRPSE